MINAIIAYAVAITTIGLIGSALGSVVSFGGLSGIGKPETWSFIGGTVGAMLAYWIGIYFFGWMGVHYGWYTYLASMFLVVINDGARANRDGPNAVGMESSHARGTMMGMVASLTTHFVL